MERKVTIGEQIYQPEGSPDDFQRELEREQTGGIRMVVGKWYVLDMFPGYPGDTPKPVSGPFDTYGDAESDRGQLNIDGDCIVKRYRGES